MFRRFALLTILAINMGTSPAHPEESPATQQATESSSAPEKLIVDGRELGSRVESHEGEFCVVCGKAITQNDVTYLAEGQRVPAHRGVCVDALSTKPADWLVRLKPRGAFLDASVAQLGLSPFWLVAGTYILIGLIFSALAAHRAIRVGRDPMCWLIIGLLSNAVGYIILIVLPRKHGFAPTGVPLRFSKVSATYSPDICPACGAENHPSARQCSSCGAALTPRVESEVQRAGLAEANKVGDKQTSPPNTGANF